MKTALMGAMLLLSGACGLSAQDESPALGRPNAGVSLSDSSASQVSLFSASDVGNFSLANAVGEANPTPAPIPTPIPAAPAANPKYVFFGDRDDYRWQLGVGVEYLRFQSSAFDASMVGLNTTLTYFTNTWFALEGDIVTAFGPTLFNSNDHGKFFGGAGGIRIGGRRARWEPWGHALVGGSHLQVQTADGGRNALLAQAGIGVDFRVHSRLSLRGEGDWVYTSYFSQTQNNFQVVAGVVFHF
ncbi:MAG: hypothetical protein WBQ89_25540 [Candidatus Acidiferrum sp.]